jgi:hypothetical protein
LTRLRDTRRTPSPRTIFPPRAENTRSHPCVGWPAVVTTTSSPPLKITSSGSNRWGRISTHGSVAPRLLVLQNRWLVRSRPPLPAQRAILRIVTRPVLERIASVTRLRWRHVVDSRHELQHAHTNVMSGMGVGSRCRVGWGFPDSTWCSAAMPQPHFGEGIELANQFILAIHLLKNH